MVEKKDVANKTSHSLLELMPLIKRDELVRLIKEVIELQKNGTLDKLLDILDKMSKKGVIDNLYLKVNDLCEKNTLKKLLEGNVLDKQIEAIIGLITDGSLMKLLDLVIEMQKKGLIDELVNYLPKMMILLEKFMELEKKGLINYDKIISITEKLMQLINDGTIDKLLELLVMLSAMLDAFNDEMIKSIGEKAGKLLELLEPSKL